MNTENNDEFEALQTSFGDKGTKVNAINYGHPHAESMLDEAKEVMMQSETGQTLIQVHEKYNFPIHIMKGVGESGFNPDSKVIYIQISGKKSEIDTKNILQICKALREAEQEIIGFTAPDPKQDLLKYASVMHAKNLDAIVYVCKFVKELTNSLLFSDLIDAISQLGYKEVYEAYDKDATEEQLFDAYEGKPSN